MSRTPVLIGALLAVGARSILAQPPEPIETDPAWAPLTGTERLQRYGREAVLSPTLYVAVVASAGIEQLDNSPPEWRQGLKGYGRRSASQFGVLEIQVGIRETAAAALRYEPRYIHSASTGFFPRLGHAALWTFITWDSDRHKRFNIPAVAAAYGSGIIATSWYPARYSALHDGVRTGNQQMAIAVGVNMIREFNPEIKRFFHLRP